MHELQIFPERGLVVLSYSGELDAKSLIDGIRAMLADPRFSPTYVGLCDLRSALIEADPEAIEKLAEWVVNDTKEASRWAYLVDGPRGTALIQYFSQIVSERHPARLFSTIGAASSYLDVELIGILR